MNNTIKKPWHPGSLLLVDDLTGHLFIGENGAHTFVIYGIDGDGQKVNITGTVTASVMRADGGTVWINTGTIVDGEVHVTLSGQCYAVPGRVVISIYVSNGDTAACIYCGITNVDRNRSDTSVDPGTIMPSVADLIARIEAAVNSIPADYSTLATQVSNQGGQINTLNASVSENAGDIADLQTDVSKIGNLSGLVTPTKTNLVQAINEAYLYDPTAAYDTEISGTSENAVQNKAIKAALDEKMNQPVGGGTAGQCLMSDGSGSLVWGTPTEVSVVLGALATKDRVQASYKPQGIISKPNITVYMEASRAYYPTSAASGGAVSPGTAAACTLPTLTATYNSEDEELVLAWTAGSFAANVPTAVTMPTFESGMHITNVTAESSTPAFTGTQATITST